MIDGMHDVNRIAHVMHGHLLHGGLCMRRTVEDPPRYELKEMRERSGIKVGKN